MSVRYGVLGLLAKEPRHGYELKNSFEEISGGFWNVNYGQIYITIDRLLKEGLLESDAQTDVSRQSRERKVYTITPKGLDELRQWLAKPVDKVRPLRDEVFIKLALLDYKQPGPILKLLEGQRQLYLSKMAELTRKKRQLKSTHGEEGIIADLLIDAALFHAEADLRWLEHCKAKIEKLGGED